MKLSERLHLCYSLNVYPGINWFDKFDAIKINLPTIQNAIPVDESNPFAIGFWLDGNSIDEVAEPENLRLLQAYLAENNYYTFTVNAFPFGRFHDASVKETVYKPDWTTDLRRDYTCRVADVLAFLMPKDVVGSISTLPGSYKSWIKTTDDLGSITRNLLKTAIHLKQLDEATGKRICLAVEMEPDCLWESPQEFISYYNHYIKGSECAEYIGVCYDTCHQELTGNLPSDGLRMLIDAGVTIGKIQLSAGLRSSGAFGNSRLHDLFQDDVYLHQTRIIDDYKIIKSFSDLPQKDCLGEAPGTCVVHFHIPVYCTELCDGLLPANEELLAVLKMINDGSVSCSNLEIETYTYDVLPESLKGQSLEGSIAEEYNYIIQKLS